MIGWDGIMGNQWVDYCNELAAERKQVLSWIKNNHGLFDKALEEPDKYFTNYTKYSDEDNMWHYDTYILRYSRAGLPNLLIEVEYQINNPRNKDYYISEVTELCDFSIDIIEQKEW